MRLVGLVVLALALVGWMSARVGGAEAAPGDGPCVVGAVVPVDMLQNMTFVPNATQIAVGDVVVWTNRAQIPHTSTEDYFLDNTLLSLVTKLIDPPLWDSGVVQAGESFSLQFCDAGEFDYHCDVHPTMRATLGVA